MQTTQPTRRYEEPSACDQCHWDYEGVARLTRTAQWGFVCHHCLDELDPEDDAILLPQA